MLLTQAKCYLMLRQVIGTHSKADGALHMAILYRLFFSPEGGRKDMICNTAIRKILLIYKTKLTGLQLIRSCNDVVSTL